MCEDIGLREKCRPTYVIQVLWRVKIENLKKGKAEAGRIGALLESNKMIQLDLLVFQCNECR